MLTYECTLKGTRRTTDELVVGTLTLTMKARDVSHANEIVRESIPYSGWNWTTLFSSRQLGVSEGKVTT